MKKASTFLSLLCILAMFGLLALQGFWIKKYYILTLNNFEKEVNLAFEDALKKEFSNRADVIEAKLKARFLDTNYVHITSEFNTTYKTITYTVSSTSNSKDKYSNTVSFRDIEKLLTKGDTALKALIASKFAKTLRSEDIENHVVFYRTQDIGKYMDELNQHFEFDTANLRPVLNKYLADRAIFVKYNFYTSANDSTTNKSNFSPDLLNRYPVITKAFPTYKLDNQQYVRVLFKDPYPYIISNIWVILASSVALIILMTCCLFLLLYNLHKAKKISAIKDDFISNITHEFKTPVATVSVIIEALENEQTIQDKEKRFRYLKHAKNELKRINSLMDKVLKLAIYDAENYTLKKERIDLNMVIKEVIDLHTIGDYTFSINFHNDTPVRSLVVNKTEFQHALSNIIENAIKYGNTHPKIDIKCALQNNFLTISIKDNGSGIPEKDIPYVFDKFHRANEAIEKNIKGYGLGLNYVQQIIKHHDGWYQLNSNEFGTEIILAWPI